ncbi:MAG: cytochrome c [Burkholderiaceae bacterium]
MTLKRISMIGLAATLIPAAAFAADGPFKDEIVARQAVMQVSKFNLGVLAAMVKGERPYDAKLAALSAKNVHLASMVDQSAMWPKGSDAANPALTVKTTADPKIWDSFPKLGELGGNFEKTSAKLEQVAGNGVDALKGAVGEVGKACKACHDDFRVKDKK